MKRIITIALVALAVCTHSAAAGAPPEPWRPVTDARVASALAIARDFWAAAPECESYELFRARLPSNEAALAEQPGCRMWLSGWVLARDHSPAALRRSEDAYLCVVVAHEYGHSLGFGHVRDRHAVMFSGLLDPKAVPACGRMLARPKMKPSRASARAGAAGAPPKGCLAANEAVAAGGDGGPPKFSEAFYHQTFSVDVSTDGFARRDLTISIEEVCNVPKGYEGQAVQLAGLDGVAVISSRTRVYKGKRLLKGASRRAQLDGADTIELTVRLARPNRWRAGEDGRVPTFVTRRASITD